MTRVLVAGASGALGRALLRELHGRGHHTRALVRDPARLRDAREAADEVVVADITGAASDLERACSGVDWVVSAAGAPVSIGPSRGRPGFREVDERGNIALADAAARAGVERFAYVAVGRAGDLPRLRRTVYLDAHERVVEHLRRSPLAATIIRPTGFFHSYLDLLEAARRGPVPLFAGGRTRENAIAEEDLAAAAADAIEAGVEELEVGGPEAHTRREHAELAFAALGRKPRTIALPAWLALALIAPLRLLDRRRHDMLAFVIAIQLEDVVAPATGSRRLEDFLRAHARV